MNTLVQGSGEGSTRLFNPMTPQENKPEWEESFNKRFKVVNEFVYFSPVYPKDMTFFIRDCIIKPLIDEIPDEVECSCGCQKELPNDLKSQLISKWLTK